MERAGPRARGAAIRGVALLAALASASASGAATLGAQETIASDRPGIGSGSFVLGRGTVQLETGVEYAEGSGQQAYALGQALVRIGFGGAELELFANSFVVQRGDAPLVEDSGFQDLGVGAKLPLVRDRDEFALSLQGVLTAPTGTTGFSSEEWSGGLVGLADFALADGLATAVNVGYARLLGGDTPDGVLSVIVTPAVTLGGGFGVYGGWAGAFASGADTHIAELGATWLRSADLQLDVNSGRDVDSGDWFLGFGLATRWGAR